MKKEDSTHKATKGLVNVVLSMAAMLLFMASCDNTPVINVPDKDTDNQLKERLINANKYIATSETAQIDAYVARRGWEMQTLTCGARWCEYAVGKGASINYEDSVTITYSVEALNGTTFYTHKTERLAVGRHQTTTGIDAALLKLHRGSKARIIVPSEAGFGVVGDGDRIPTRAVLVYDLTVE